MKYQNVLSIFVLIMSITLLSGCVNKEELMGTTTATVEAKTGEVLTTPGTNLTLNCSIDTLAFGVALSEALKTEKNMTIEVIGVGKNAAITSISSGVLALYEGNGDTEIQTNKEEILGNHTLAVISKLDNSLEGISFDELHGLAVGEIDSIADKSISLVVPTDETGTRGAFERIFETKEKVNGREKSLIDDYVILKDSEEGVISEVNNALDYLGVIGLTNTSDVVKILPINGVLPNETTISDGTYLGTEPIILSAGASDEESLKVIMDFIHTESGQKLMETYQFSTR